MHPMQIGAKQDTISLHADEVQVIFSNIEDIYNTNKVLLDGLVVRMTDWSDTQKNRRHYITAGTLFFLL